MRKLTSAGPVKFLGDDAKAVVAIKTRCPVDYQIFCGVADLERIVTSLQEQLLRMKDRAVRSRPRRLGTRRQALPPTYAGSGSRRKKCADQYEFVPVCVPGCKRVTRDGGLRRGCCPPACDFLCHDHYRGIDDKVWHCWANKSTREKRTL